MKQYEIWWASLPLPAGHRPVLLLSRDASYGYLNKVAAAEITTKIRGLPTEVPLGRDEGLTSPSVATMENIRSISRDLAPTVLMRLGFEEGLVDLCRLMNNTGEIKVEFKKPEQPFKIEAKTELQLYRIVQEIINNVMKHAAAKTAIVQVSKSDDQLSVTVEDDGKGFDPSVIKATSGIGWANIQNRVDFLKGKLDVHSEPGKGTSILIELHV